MTRTKPHLFILCGEAFSGKSTLAQRIADTHRAKIVGRDVAYFALEKVFALDETPEDDDSALWESLWPVVLQGVKNNLSTGNSVVVDDNCLYRRQRDALRAIAQEVGVSHTLIYLDTSAGTINARKADNKVTQYRHDVPSAWIEEDAAVFERPGPDEKPLVHPENVVWEEWRRLLDSSASQ